MPIVRRKRIDVIQQVQHAHQKHAAIGGLLANRGKPEREEAGADDDEYEFVDGDLECVHTPLEFRDRHERPASYDWQGTLVYLVFIGLFLYLTLEGRSHGYFFTKCAFAAVLPLQRCSPADSRGLRADARDVVDVDKFMKIDNSVTYREWLECRFFPGMHWNSVDRPAGGAASIVLVGPPRIRVVRANVYNGSLQHHRDLPHTEAEANHPPQCGHAPEMFNTSVLCFDLREPEDVNSSDWFQSPTWFDSRTPNPWYGVDVPPTVADDQLRMEYQSGEQLQESPYSSYTGEQYPGSGHVVRHISKLFEAPPTKEIEGVR